MSIIACENITIAYDGKIVLDSLNFTVERGDYLSIVGENGSGKTTLMKIMLGLKKADRGKVIFEKGCKTGYLPQQSSHQKDFPASVMEIVLSGCMRTDKFRPFFTAADRAKAREAMERLGIWDIRKSSYQVLSGGQQQRVLLARALCATSDILFLDEPVSGLDPVVTRDMYHIIEELNDSGLTIVMISHDIEAAVEYSSKILHLGKKLEFFGPTEEYKKTDLCEHYLCHIAEHLHHGDDCEICQEIHEEEERHEHRRERHD